MSREVAIRFLLVWAINTGVIFLLPQLLPTVYVRDLGAAMLVALVLALFNAVLRPILLILTLPITVLSLGLFVFILNGLIFWLAAWMLPGFEVESFWWAVLAAAVYGMISWVLSSVLLRQSDPRNQ